MTNQDGGGPDTSLVSGHDVSAERVLARAEAGGPTAPMVEIDPEGRTVFVGGNWDALVGEGIPGPDALAALLDSSDQAAAVMDAIEAALDHGASTDVEIALAEPRWVRVRPIPSANRAGVSNVLVGVAWAPNQSAPTDPGFGRGVDGGESPAVTEVAAPPDQSADQG